MEVEASGWKGPVSEEIDFAEGRTIAMQDEVMPYVLNVIHEEFTFVKAKTDLVLDKDFAGTVEE